MEAKSADGRPTPASIEASAAASATAPPPAAETLNEAPRRRASGSKRKSSGPSHAAAPSSISSKRPVKERSLFHHVLSSHNGPCTRARQSPNKHAEASANKLPDYASTLGWVSESGGGIKPEEVEVVEEPLVDKEFEAVRSRGVKVHAVPTPAGWFSWKAIHSVEKHMVPSFFNEKFENRTPRVYMEIRNSIMKKFHSDPQTQVELKDFSELSVGDNEARQEVFEFLDHWGLINFHPFPPFTPESSKSDADDSDRVISLVDKLYIFEEIHSFPRVAPKKEDPIVPKVQPSLHQESALVDDLSRPVGPSVGYHCNSCSADCSRKRYHCQTQADFDLCTDCFNDGKFGSGMTRADFILMESAEVPGLSGGSWTDQETLLLLEALELFGENWNEISEHVATKTKAQCILHFLQMPIEDSFLDSDNISVDINLESKDKIASNKESTATNNSELMEVDKKEEEESSTKDALEDETKKVDNSDNADEPMNSNADTSANGNIADVNNFSDSGINSVIDVLKTAFEAVGYFPEQEGLGSFAEAGNPVMALAAFLSGLVEPDAIVTSCRSSLRSMSEDSPNIQLATRHCFILEDPPSDSKDPTICVRSGTEIINEESHKDENKLQSLDATDKSKEQNANVVEMESDGKSSSMQDSSVKQIDEKEVHAVTPNAMPTTVEDSDQSLSGEKSVAGDMESATNNALSIDPIQPSVKENEDLSCQNESEKHQKENSGPNVVEDKQNDMKNSSDLASADKIQQLTNSAEVADKANTSEGQESLQTGGSNDETKAGDCVRKESCSSEEKNINLDGIDEDHSVERLKRAAVTALSAAAVKAKLLAKLEEDEILKLVSLIVEKQLHKLEVKLGLFAGIESVVLKMREQTEKARQRLMLERSQIIAARLGVATSSLRPNPAAMPMNRVAMGYGPPNDPRTLNMANQKQPPLRRL